MEGGMQKKTISTNLDHEREEGGETLWCFTVGGKGHWFPMGKEESMAITSEKGRACQEGWKPLYNLENEQQEYQSVV